MLVDYIVDGVITTLILKNRKEVIIECLVDTEDLEKILNHKHNWYPAWYEDIQSYYVRCNIYLGFDTNRRRGKYTALFLHRFVLDIYDSDVVVDHKNNNSLDCRKCNLRITEDKFNTKNRKSKNANNTSGYRNVSWLNGYKKWCVQLQIDGKNTILGKFDDVDEAGLFAEEMRKKYYQEYKGQN